MPRKANPGFPPETTDRDGGSEANIASTASLPFASRPGWLRLAQVLSSCFRANHVYSPERLLAAGARHAGMPARYPGHIGEALEVLCRSLRDDAKLHRFGEVNLQALLVTGLGNLLQVEEAFVADAELADTRLQSPLVITGFARSGTTFLHRLLSTLPSCVGITLRQHLAPLPYRPVDYRRPDIALRFLPRRLAAQAYQVDAMHFLRPNLPDECNFGMRSGGRSMVYWSTAASYSYLDWLLHQDLRETYQHYRKVLLVHQRCYPRQRLILKCPQHLAWLPALCEAIPEATIVQMHRDPRDTVPSECKLFLSLQALSTKELDAQRTVHAIRARVATFADRSLAFDRGPDSHRIHHVQYHQLLMDPLRTVQELSEQLAIPCDEATTTQPGRFLQQHQQHRHGRNAYNAAQYGLSPADLNGLLVSYRERFLPETLTSTILDRA